MQGVFRSRWLISMVIAAVMAGSFSFPFGKVEAAESVNLVNESIEVTTSSSVEAWGFSRASLLKENKIQPGWSSSSSLYENHTEWFSVDLEALHTLDRIELFPRNDDGNIGEGFPIDFTIQVSTNALEWTTVRTVTGYEKPDGAARSFAFDDIAARYVKVEATNLRTVEGSYRMQLRLFKAYGDPTPIADSEPPLTTVLDTARLAETGSPTLQQPNVTVEWEGLYRQQWMFYDLFGRKSILDTPTYMLGNWTPQSTGEYRFALIAAVSASDHPDDPAYVTYYETVTRDSADSIVSDEPGAASEQDIRYRMEIDDVATIDGVLTAPAERGTGEPLTLAFRTDYLKLMSNLDAPLDGSYVNTLYVGVAREGDPNYEALIPLVAIEHYEPEGVNLRLASPIVGGVYTDREQAELTLNVFNTGAAAAPVAVEYTITPIGGTESVEQGQILNELVPARSERTVRLAPGALPNGVYTVAVQAGGASAQTRLAIVPEQDVNDVADSGITFGMNTFWRQITWQAYQIPLTAKAGMKWIRPWLDGENIWAVQEPEAGVYNWEPLDKTLAMLEPYGIGYFDIMAFAPDWAKRSTGWAPRPDSMDNFAEYVEAFFDRYKNAIPYVSAWNEPNGPEFWDTTQTSMESLPEYVDMVNLIETAASNAGGTIKLVGPSLGAPVNDDASDYWGPFPEWFEEFGGTGSFGKFDTIDIHPYDQRRLGIGPEKSLSSGAYEEQLDRLWQIVQSSPGGAGKKLAITETAYPAIDDADYAANELLQAQLMQRQYLMSAGSGKVDKVFWFAMIDPLSNQADAQAVDASYGMFYNGYVPKLVYAAQAGMASILNNATGLGRIRTEPGTWGYAFTKGSQSIIALWRETNAAPMDINFPTQAESVQVLDMFGNAENVAVNGNAVSVHLTQSPIYIVADNGAGALNVSEAGLADGTAGSAYSTVLHATGGVLPYSWSAEDLPAGLSIHSVTGEVYGVPEAAGVSTVHVAVTDSVNATASRDVTITVRDQGESVNLAEGKAVDASSSVEGWGFSKEAAVDGQTTGNGWSSDSELGENHTEWLSVDLGAEYAIDRVDLYPRNGSDEEVGQGFPIDFTIQVSTDAVHWTTVASRTEFARPGAGAQSFAFDEARARYVKVEGTNLMSVDGSYRMQLAELQAFGNPDSSSPLGIWNGYLNAGMVAVDYRDNLYATGGLKPYTWSADGLPAGLTIDPAVGELRGMPEASAAGTAIVRVSVTDSSGATASRELPLTINAAIFANQALNKTVTASSSVEGWGFSKDAAVDGTTTGNGWSSDSELGESHTEWLSVDLGSDYMLDRVDLYPRNGNADDVGKGFPVDFAIQVSTDSVHWTTVASRTDVARPGAGAQSFAFDETRARYVKVEGTKLTSVDGAYRMQLAELQAFGYAAPPSAAAYRVSYDGNGHTGGSAPADGNVYESGSNATVLGNDGNLARTGYEFAGWNTAPDGSGTGYTPGDMIVVASSSIVLYAQWIAAPDAVFVNQALNKTVTASSSVEGWGFSKEAAVDGQTAGNGWSSDSELGESHTEWLSVDLGADYMIDRVDLYPRNGNEDDVGKGFPVDFTIQVSTDAIHWATVASRTEFARPGAGAQSFAFDETRARYVKVEGTRLMSVDGSYRMQLAELQAFGYAAPPLAAAYRVSYDGNGHTGGSAPTDGNVYESGLSVIVLGNDGNLARTGCEFAGWNTAPDGSGTDYAAGETLVMGASAVTLYAKWTAVDSTAPGNAAANTASPGQVREAVVSFGADNGMAVPIRIVRTVTASGGKVDAVELDAAMAEAIVSGAISAEQSKAVILLDDLPNDKADEYTLSVPLAVARLLSDRRIVLEVRTGDVTVTLPQNVAANLGDKADGLKVRIVPIRSDKEQAEAKRRALDSSAVKAAEEYGEAQAVGLPVIVETNYSGLPTKLMFPIDTSERKDDLASLAVFIEHSDGEEVLQQADIRYDDKGEPVGVEIEVDKFSTFTVLRLAEPEIREYRRYINGFEDGTFRPSKPVTRAELAAMVARNMPDPSDVRSAQTILADVASDHWAADSINRVYAAGIMTGSGNGQFRPDETVTRAELAAVLARWNTLDAAAGGESAFADVKLSWAAEAIAAVQAQGWMRGYPDGTFRPDNGLTRAEAVRALNAALGREPFAGAEPVLWTDVPTDYWAWADIMSASRDYRIPIPIPNPVKGDGRESQ
ncbi:discoidin domain-containing protein [Cohnella fermenti]|uniref:F5/8 type C domain-containing protein n=1 Tax=Cohnella fermenti TaxID=2565925 RepID=A0A4V3WEF2_9BACL|nr:discoidin domain-containing protein [Cohnella fermenti]THF76090.1 hypothetical protein E6C55_20155 [Cohnella fermenti]